MEYIVELYNKDDDNYKTILKTTDKKSAFQLCETLGAMCKEDEIIASRYDNKVGKGTEYYDWCQVVDSKLNPLRKFGCLTDWTSDERQ